MSSTTEPYNVKTSVTQWLQDNGYDGLYLPGVCSCALEDLMPCNTPSYRCLAGYKYYRNNDCADTCEFYYECEGFCIYKED